MAVIAAVGHPVTDYPIVGFGLSVFGILVAAFVVGALLFQFRLGAIWCLAACEAFFLCWYFYAVYPGNTHYREFDFLQILSLFFLLPPTYLGYYFNKHIVH